MKNINKHNYIPLPEPIPITEQVWPEGTLPLVVVSTNTYNHVAYIRDCIEGILMQKTTFPVKVVIFDDYSTDGTREIVQEYESKFPHVIKGIYPKENTWKKPGRKEALKPRNEIRNTAKYIALCEGDDYWTDPLKLQKQVSFLEEHPDYSLVCGGFKSIDTKTGEEKIIIKEVEKSKDNTEIGFDITIERFFKQWLTKTLTLVYRRELYNANDFKNYKYSRDVHLNYHLLKNGKGYYMKEVFGVYHIHQGGIFSLKSKQEKIKYGYLVYKELLIENKNDEYLYKKYISFLKKMIQGRVYQEYINLSRKKLNLELLFSSRDFNQFKCNLKFIIKNYLN